MVNVGNAFVLPIQEYNVGDCFVRILMDIGISVILEDGDLDLWRFLQAIKEACMVGGRCYREIGLQMSRSKRRRKCKVGLKTCSMIQVGIFELGVNHALTWVSREA